MNERLKKLRKALDLTQREFAEKVGIKQNTLATYEIGRNKPIDAVVSLICKTFNASETWLRNGEGEMFNLDTREDELAKEINRLLAGESQEFRNRLIEVLVALGDEYWKVLEQYTLDLAQDKSAPTPASVPSAGQTEPAYPDNKTEDSDLEFDPEIEAELKTIRNRLYREKGQREILRILKSGGSATWN